MLRGWIACASLKFDSNLIEKSSDLLDTENPPKSEEKLRIQVRLSGPDLRAHYPIEDESLETVPTDRLFRTIKDHDIDETCSALKPG